MHAQIDVQTDGQSRPFNQNRKMLLIYQFVARLIHSLLTLIMYERAYACTSVYTHASGSHSAAILYITLSYLIYTLAFS